MCTPKAHSTHTAFKHPADVSETAWHVTDDDGWITYNRTIWHDIFHGMELARESITYGQDRVNSRMPYDWAVGFDSFDERFYEIRLQEQADGTYQVQLPHVWLLNFDGMPGYVFRVLENDAVETIPVPASHVFTLTNYSFHDIPVEKSWHPSVGPNDISDAVTVYLLQDGVRVKDENGNDRYLVLRKEEGWQNVFDKLPPLSLKPGVYSLEESAPGFIAIPGERSDQTVDLVFDRAHSRDIDGRYYDLRHPYTLDENFSLNLRISVDGGDFIEGEALLAKESTGCDQNGCFSFFDVESGESLITIRNIPVSLKKNGFRIAYYLDNGNFFHGHHTMYDLYLNQGDDGIYTLYLPQLLPDGSSRDIFVLDGVTHHGDYAYTLTNVKEPTHNIDIEKIWTVESEDDDKVPEQIVITMTDKNGKVQTVTLTANENEALNWKAVLESLTGYYALLGYTITEADIAGFEQVQQWQRLLLAAKPHFDADAARTILLELPDGTRLNGTGGRFDDARLSELLLSGN